MEDKRTLRIVLASPGDVTAERDVVAAVLSEVDGICRDLVPPLALELWRWETDSYPELHLEGPQGIIDSRLRIDQSDIFVAIFRRRFGTPVIGADSGTEHEIHAAIHAWRTQGAPRVMLYFADDPGDKNAVEYDEQYQKVQEFKSKLMRQEKALVECFRDLASFELKMRRHLMQVALQIHGDLAAGAEPENGLVRVSWRPEVVHLRHEGYTELLGSFFLEMTYQSRTAPTSPLHVVVLIYLNTTITSRPNDPILFEVGRPGANIYLSASNFQGNHIASNNLAFPAFQLDGMLPGEKRTFQVCNVRCNATLHLPDIYGILTVAGGVVEKGNQRIAVVGEGLRFEVVRSDGKERSIGGVLSQSTSLSPTRVATLRFTEGFPNAFKMHLPAYGGVTSRKDGPVAYGSESGYFGMATRDSSGQCVLSNLADFGTRVEASFHCVPSGLRLFVTDSADGGAASIGARLAKSESSTCSDNNEFDGRTACELVVREGSALAVWQMNPSAPYRSSGLVSLDFGVFVEYEACPASNRPLLGTTTVNGSFSPTAPPGHFGGFSSSSSVLPMPRFCGPVVCATELFRIVT